jgi:3-phenylpropionate/cinnamic acid dioxygenase small subunit
MEAGELRDAVTQFLALEAMLLDEGRFEEWLDLLDENLLYMAPIRSGSEHREEELAGGGYRFNDSKDLIRVRLKRIQTGKGYSELPYSRTVRSVSSIYLSGIEDGVVSVSSAFIVFRQRGNDAHSDTLHGRRDDKLRVTSDGLRLLSRRINLAEVSLSTPNLGIFL